MTTDPHLPPRIVEPTDPSRSLIVVGLSASGKTSYARGLLAGRSHYVDIHHWLYYREEHVRAGDDRFGCFLDDLQAGRPWVIGASAPCGQPSCETTLPMPARWVGFSSRTIPTSVGATPKYSNIAARVIGCTGCGRSTG